MDDLEAIAKRKHAWPGVWLHATASLVLLLLVFFVRWYFATLSNLSRLSAATLSVGALVGAILVLGRYVHAPRGLRLIFGVTAAALTVVATMYAPLGHERDRILNDLPRVAGGTELGRYNTGFFCADYCHAGIDLAYQASVEEIFAAQKQLVEESKWRIYEQTDIEGPTNCIPQGHCSLAAQRGALHAHFAVVNDGSLTRLQISLTASRP